MIEYENEANFPASIAVQREIILAGINSIEEIFNHSDKDIIEFPRECDLVNQLSTSNSQHTLHRNMFQTYCILPDVYYCPYPMETTKDKSIFIHVLLGYLLS